MPGFVGALLIVGAIVGAVGPEATIAAAQAATATPTATANPTVGPRLIATTDFQACDVPAGLVAGQPGWQSEGLRRAAVLEEQFSGPVDPARWRWGSWNGGQFSPAPAGGSLAVQAPGGSAWLRSQAGFTQQTIEGRAAFGAGPWQHVGWGDESLAMRWAMFSTAESSGLLYARSFDGARELRTNLPGVALGVEHDLRIAWGSAGVDYYVDGALVASHAIALAEPMYLFASDNTASATLSVQELRVATYTPGSTAYMSCVADAGAPALWERLTYRADLPTGTELTLETRSSTDRATWSAWSGLAPDGTIGSPAGRYLQYRATLSSSATDSARLREVDLWPSADFGACSLPAGLALADEPRGELRRAATIEDDFAQAPSPARWSWGSWDAGTYLPAPVGGVLPVGAPGSSAWLRSSGPFTGTTLEGRATFGAAGGQQVGWGDSGLVSKTALLTTASSGTGLLARTFDGQQEASTLLTGVALNASHSFRVVVGAAGVDYYVDGALAASHSIVLTEPLYAYASNNGGGQLSVDWLRIDAYPAGSADYLSCQHDLGVVVDWGQLSWRASVPPGTDLTLSTRSSSDGQSWSAWAAVAASGGTIVSPAGRYLQYRATLTSSATDSPRLVDVWLSAQPRSPAPGPTATPSPTAVPPAAVDTTGADFALGTTPVGLTVADEAGGEVRLAAALESYFGAPPSPTLWSWGTWNNTSYVPAPSAGALPVESPGGSAWLRSSAAFDKQTLEGRVAFGAGPWQHVGFADQGFAVRWAIFSTAEGGTTLYARTFDGMVERRTPLSGVAPGAYHDLRIAWDAAGVDYYVDGALAASHPIALPAPMYAYASNNGPAGLSVDFLRVASYGPSLVTYLSSVRDAGAAMTWSELRWDAQTPAGTGLTFETRSSADGVGWSGWLALGDQGAIASPPGRYLQYRASLAGTATDSPRLDRVALWTTSAPPTPTPTVTVTATATPTVTATATATPTATPTLVGTVVAVDRRTAAPGASASVAVPGIAATLNRSAAASGPATIEVARYGSTSPAPPAGMLGLGAHIDLRIYDAVPSDSVAASFYYSASIAGADEAALSLLYFDGSTWLPVLSSGGVAPSRDTTDNLDGTTSGGRFNLTFDATSRPAVTELTGTVFGQDVPTTPTPTATSTATLTETPTSTATATATATASATATGTATPTPSDTATATATATSTPTETPSATASATESATSTASATATATATPTGTATATPSGTATPTETTTPSSTSTETATGTSTATPTSSATDTATATPTETATATSTATSTATATDTATPTDT
ncbi:MAG TPA: hypothetical protein VGL23_00525, partial [Chloroflexota bacterium]